MSPVNSISRRLVWDRIFKLVVLVATPLLGTLYFSQHTGASLGKTEVIVPFKVERAPNLSGVQNKISAPPDWAKNKISVVSFWATWCPPCVEEMPAMAEAAARLEAKGVRFYFVSIDENWTKVQTFLDQNIIDISPEKLFLDSTREVAGRWGSDKFPETYIINSDGWEVEKVVGFQEWTRPAVIEYFQRLAGDTSVAQKSYFQKKVNQIAGLILPTAFAADDKNAAAPLIHEDDKKALSKIQLNVETANKNVQKLEAAVKDEQRSLREVSIKTERQQRDATEVEGQLSKLQDSIRDVEKVKKKNDDSLSAEKNERARVTRELADLQKKLKDLEKEIEQTRDNVVLVNQKLSTRNQNIESFEKAVASSNDEGKSLREREKKMLSNVKAKNGDINDLRKDTSTRESKIKSLEGDLASWNEKLNKEKQKLVDFEKLLK